MYMSRPCLAAVPKRLHRIWRTTPCGAVIGVAVFCLVAFCHSECGAASIPLSDLVGTGRFIDVDDKRFDRFLFESTVPAHAIFPMDISVEGLPGIDPGLLFTTPTMKVHADPGQTVQAGFNVLFRVTVLDPNKKIHDASLSFKAVVDSHTTGPIVGARIVEVVKDPSFSVEFGRLVVEEPGNSSANTTFAPQATVIASKNVFVIAVADTGTADSQIDSFTQTFSQITVTPPPPDDPPRNSTIPEPSSLLIASLLGVVGAIARKRRAMCSVGNVGVSNS